jgi:hypothetical protein
VTYERGLQPHSNSLRGEKQKLRTKEKGNVITRGGISQEAREPSPQITGYSRQKTSKYIPDIFKYIPKKSNYPKFQLCIS